MIGTFAPHASPIHAPLAYPTPIQPSPPPKHNKTDLGGKTIIVTGASAGVGKESARLLAAWGADVIMAVRSPEKGEAVRADIQASTGSDKLEVRGFGNLGLMALCRRGDRVVQGLVT